MDNMEKEKREEVGEKEWNSLNAFHYYAYCCCFLVSGNFELRYLSIEE